MENALIKRKEDDLEPDDDFWNKTTYMDYHNFKGDDDIFETKLDDRDKQVFNVIENIYSMVSLGMNFSMKIIGFDQLVKRFTKNNMGDYEYNESHIRSSFVKGASSFTNYPRGMINYHAYNYPLFKLTTIALMLVHGVIPVEYIDELENRIESSDSSRLFKIKRSSGAIQTACVTKRSSIVYKKSSSKSDLKKYWKIDVNFYDHSSMNDKEIKESDKNLIEGSGGLFNKGIDIAEFLQLNDIDHITLNITKLKLDILNHYAFENYNDSESELDSDSDSDSNSKSDSEIVLNEAPYFFNENGKPDDFLKNNINYVHENTRTYFLNRLDEYIPCLEKSLADHNVILITI